MSGLTAMKTSEVRSTRSQRGAVIVLVAILFGSGVLLGMVSLVIDSGQLLLEKTITQVASDNVASALAHACSLSSTECTSAVAANSSLVTIAHSSFSQHPSAILSVCGSASAVVLRPSLTTCGGFSGIPRDCVTPSANYANYVRVYTGYTAATGGTPLFPLLNNLIRGTSLNPSIESCSQAAWGTLSQITNPDFPMVMSLCAAVEPAMRTQADLPLALTDKIVEGLSGTQNGPATANCASQKDQTGKQLVTSAANFIAFEVFAKPVSGKIAIGDTLTENATWNTTNINTYKNALASNIGVYKKYPVVVNTALSSKVVVAFVNFKLIAYRYGTTYYPNTAAVKAAFPTAGIGNSCTYFCLVGGISNATAQTAGMLAPTGPAGYNLGVNTIVQLQ